MIILCLNNMFLSLLLLQIQRCPALNDVYDLIQGLITGKVGFCLRKNNFVQGIIVIRHRLAKESDLYSVRVMLYVPK